MAWSYGYFTDLNYTHGYYPEMNPAMLRLACLCNGVEPQLPAAPSYLELGFGQGVTINMLAAASPGSYWGTDFNPAQTVEARKLADASRADIHLFDDSFEEFAGRRDLPDFDVIALHGIWSWISEKNRKIITDIIRRKLRPGGIAYISYNCLPGWAPVLPIRQLMSLYQDYGGGKMSRPTEMIEGALQFAEETAKAGSFYFQDNPFARHHLEQLTKQGRNYLGHEYMNADWHLEHFSDMVRSLDEAKLTYVGSARLLDGIDAFQLHEEGIKFLSQISHPIMRETVRDYLVNRRFRTDIFVKGARLLPGREHRDAWHALAFVLVIPEIDVPKKIVCARGEVALPADKYDLILEALADEGYRPKRVEELVKHNKLRSLKSQDVVGYLTVLTGAGFAAPAQIPSEKVKEQCRALNRHILQRALVSMDLHHMVSPVTGGGIGLTHMTQLFVLASSEGKVGAAALASYVWDFLDSIGERLMRDGKKIESKDENLKEIRVLANKFLKFGRPLLEALQIIDAPEGGGSSDGAEE
ncbi:Methyltransferase domain-containing protein [Xaviernesmea oryzae]|uniref:Methyltransferase domain-containing protein n=1 Tax=Xaviernesmea oryzae TaxID=464029 RepID=A0A1X7FWY7_9HYPH|nr:class I SAM-dependent methyltransferase [Xaviernesmea oryzae]SMF60218.1 Methyltransferase domain-containing protein [Xaviernesmea oryzae]